MYGNVHRKIITNSPDAWSLTGVAKRLSFAVDNMNLPIAELSVETPGGGSVSVFRHGNMEIWNLKSGGRKYFQFKILRDDGTYIGEDEIEGIEIFLDTGEFNKIGEVYCPPIMYVWNLDIGLPETDPEVIKIRDTMYNLKQDGTRGTKRYNPKTKVWTFDGYQRPWSWLYGLTETDDLTKPTSPPYMEGAVHIPSNRYNSDIGKYESKKTLGYFVRVKCKKDSVDSYYRKPKDTDPAGQLARGYKYDNVLFHWDQTDASLVLPGSYLFRMPYYWKTDVRYTTESQPGWINYGEFLPSLWPSLDYFGFDNFYNANADTIYPISLSVRSSIPYYIEEHINTSMIFAHGLGDANSDFASYNWSTYVRITGTILDGVYYTRTPVNRIVSEKINYPRTFTPVDILTDQINSDEMNTQIYSGSTEAIGGGPLGGLEAEGHRVSHPTEEGLILYNYGVGGLLEIFSSYLNEI